MAGGGASFYFKRRGAFDLSFIRGAAVAPRTVCEPLFGREVLGMDHPPIRAVWVTAGNPVAMLPESETTVRALCQCLVEGTHYRPRGGGRSLRRTCPSGANQSGRCQLVTTQGAGPWADLLSLLPPFTPNRFSAVEWLLAIGSMLGRSPFPPGCFFWAAKGPSNFSDFLLTL